MGKQILESNKKGDDIVSNIKISKKFSSFVFFLNINLKSTQVKINFDLKFIFISFSGINKLNSIYF